MSTNNTVIYSQGAIDYHRIILNTPFDGSEANRHTKKEAAKYIRGWIDKLTDFANLSDTRVSVICKTQAIELMTIIIKANNLDGIKW